MNSPRVSTTKYTTNPIYRIRNFFTRKRQSTDPKPLTNSNNNANKKSKYHRKKRRGGITYKNASRIRGTFQKPPLPPSRVKYNPQYFAGPLYMNNNDPVNPFNNNTSIMTAAQINEYMRRIRAN
jgi:hypothetical protein